MEAQHSAHRERISKTELACYLERETALVKAEKLQVVSDGFNRYPEQSGQLATGD